MTTLSFVVKLAFRHCLWKRFLQEDLYATICGLSYMGDVRMLFAEDKHKVKIEYRKDEYALFKKCLVRAALQLHIVPQSLV